MVGTNHLGTETELKSFLDAMNLQLLKHQDEKISMRDWTMHDVLRNNLPEIISRTKKIQMLYDDLVLNCEDLNSVKNLKSHISKQFVHIGNYAMMGWLKSQ